MKELRQKLQDAATTGNGTVASLGLACNTPSWLISVKGAGTVTTGKIQVETAESASDADTWQAIGSEIVILSATTITQAFEGAYRHVRARISEDVTGSGGSVTVYATAMSAGA